MKFSIKGFFSKDDQIRSLLRIWSHLLKKSLKKNFILCTVSAAINFSLQKPPHTRTLEDDSSENSGNFEGNILLQTESSGRVLETTYSKK